MPSCFLSIIPVFFLVFPLGETLPSCFSVPLSVVFSSSLNASHAGGWCLFVTRPGPLREAASLACFLLACGPSVLFVCVSGHFFVETWAFPVMRYSHSRHSSPLWPEDFACVSPWIVFKKSVPLLRGVALGLSRPPWGSGFTGRLCYTV